MLPHQQRVVDEATELKDKRDKLGAFFSTEIYNGLDEIDKGLLVAQHGAMVAYSNILDLRISRF